MALDWAAPSDRPHDDRGAPSRVNVVIPVYQAPEAFARCLAALLAHTDLCRHRALLVLDGPQPASTEALLETPIPGIEILRNPERRGFVASVNFGMARGPEQDVVLLNSDAIVTAGWLEKLRAAAYSAAEIATVTPFSNTATICSLPRFLAANALPAGETIEGFARRIEQRSARAYPRLPTGVGVCLYLKRRALAELGLFDERAFGLGYGEESEWCQRALKAGWRHVLDDATFVYHEGHQSFGTTRGSRVRGAHRALAKLHPDYLATIARFVQEDPLAPVRARALAGLAPTRQPALSTRSPNKIVHLVHGWPPWSPAGTESYAAWLVRRQAAHREVAVYARIADPARALGDAVELLDASARVRLMVNNFVQRDPRSRNALRDGTLERDFARFLDEERPDLLHVHHLAGHAATLPREARRRGIPVLYQVQDWWTVCARANLLDAERRACSGPGLVKCSRCLPLTALPGAALLNPLLYAERGRLLRSALRTADARVAGSQFLADSLRALLDEPNLPIEVIPYGVELGGTPRIPHVPREPARPLRPPLRFGFLGSILPHKGLHVAARAFTDLDPKRVRLDIYGDRQADPAYAEEVRRIGGAAIEWHGRFAEEDKAVVLGRLDALIVPSLGLESFGLAAREAMAAGTPVLAARRGALAELPLETLDCGAFFDPEKPEELRAGIERLVAAPEILDGWRARLPAVTGMDEHAGAIEALYARVLARKGAA